MKQQAEKPELRKPSRKIIKVLTDNIRTFREKRNISQEKLADMCNVHRTYIGSVERGERNVTLSTLEAIANALGVTVPMLLTEDSIKNEQK